MRTGWFTIPFQLASYSGQRMTVEQPNPSGTITALYPNPPPTRRRTAAPEADSRFRDRFIGVLSAHSSDFKSRVGFGNEPRPTHVSCHQVAEYSYQQTLRTWPLV